jgi:hypothetical protein
VVHLLETEYGLLGSRRVGLAGPRFPGFGGAVLSCARPYSEWLDGVHRYRGQWQESPSRQIRRRLPVGHAGLARTASRSLEQLATLPKDPEGAQARSALLQQRLVRIVEYGWQHPTGPVLLTLADLAAMLSLSPVRVSELLAEARRTTGKPLLTKGYYFDQGMRPTHKDEIIALYEAGLDEADIARQTGHAQVSVGQYIRDYERVKLLLTHQILVQRIPQLIGMQPNVARAYVELAYQYHPDLKPEEVSPPQP